MWSSTASRRPGFRTAPDRPSTDPIEYREGGFENTVHKLPGLTKFNNITLKWGLTDSRELYEWYRDTTKGKIQRKHGSIVVRDNAGQEKVRWNFYNAWPTKWTGPTFTAKGNDVAIDSLDLAVESIERA